MDVTQAGIAYFIVKSEKSLGKNLINALKEVDEKLDICPDTGMVLLKGEESPLSSDSRNSEILCICIDLYIYSYIG